MRLVLISIKCFIKLNDNWLDFINSYEKFIKNEISKIISKPFLCQYLPSYRVQLPNDQAIHKWHYDSDEDHKHPEGEINFCLAINRNEGFYSYMV